MTTETATKPLVQDSAAKADTAKMLRSETVDWRPGVKTETGTVASDTAEIKRLEASRDRGVAADMDVARKKSRVHNLLLDVCKGLEWDVENLAPKFSPKSYESENLVFTIEMRSREMNVKFEGEFLALAGKHEFIPMVVHELHKANQYRLTDTDGKMIILESESA